LHFQQTGLMPIILGVILHFLGGFASGSFYIPYKKVKGWAWETLWIVGGIFSWLIVPPIAAWLTIPDFLIITSQATPKVLLYTWLFGALWGIGGLTYGLGVRYLGVSLGSTIILGLCAVFGSIIPSVYYNIFPESGKDNFNTLLFTSWGHMVLSGVVLCVVGIVICGKAGTMKEKELLKSGLLIDNNKDYKFSIGLGVAIVSGILSACFNFGIEAGKPMAEMANELWKAHHNEEGNFLFQNNITYIIILWGGLTTNFIWCMIMNFRNKTFGDYIDPKTPLLQNYLFCALAGTTWFLQFFFYGMGESKLGNGPSSWILHMAFIILVANSWGLVLKEWKSVSRKTIAVLIMGILAIVLSVTIVGYGNLIK
jgi:L-rhamnose-H+ transport protein